MKANICPNCGKKECEGHKAFRELLDHLGLDENQVNVIELKAGMKKKGLKFEIKSEGFDQAKSEEFDQAEAEHSLRSALNRMYDLGLFEEAGTIYFEMSQRSLDKKLEEFNDSLKKLNESLTDFLK